MNIFIITKTNYYHNPTGYVTIEDQYFYNITDAQLFIDKKYNNNNMDYNKSKWESYYDGLLKKVDYDGAYVEHKIIMMETHND